MRIAIVYDCLYPYTVGGAERRYRSVVAQLAPRFAGHLAVCADHEPVAIDPVRALGTDDGRPS